MQFKFTRDNRDRGPVRPFFDKLLIMAKITAFILLVTCLQVSASGTAQTVTLSEKNASLASVFMAIREQTGYNFIYNVAWLRDAHPVTISVKDATLLSVLDSCFKGQPFTYTIIEKTIALKLKKVLKAEQPGSRSRPSDTTRDVRGRIVNEAGQPVPGATIRVSGTTLGTIPNGRGEFKLDHVGAGAMLVISSIGYKTEEIRLNKQSFIQVILHEKKNMLDEMQIIGYGTTTKRLNPGDITTITAKDIEKNPVNNVLEAVQGKVPGLFIQQVTGQPGGAFTVRLRGSTNFSSGAIPPLVVVDGVRYPAGTLPLSSNTLYTTAGFLQGGSGLNYLNPNDIASIDVLKDADATAIYGSAGAYGVIIITTKKAKAGAPTLNINVYTGVSVKGEMPDLLNTKDYLMLRREAIKNDGLTVGPGDLDLNGTWDSTRDEHWRDQFLGSSAENTNINVSYGGGTDYTNYLISGSLRKNGNIQRHKGSFNDGSLRFSLNTGTANGKFKLSLSATYLSSKDDMVPYDFSIGALTPPNAPPAFSPDGSIDWESIGTSLNSSAVASNANRTYKNVTNNLLANASLVYRPVSKLTLRTTFGYNNITSKELSGYPTTTLQPSTTNAGQQTHSIFNHYEIRSLSISPYAEYNTVLGSKGNLSIKAGGEIDNKLTYADNIAGTGFSSDALLSNPAAAITVNTSYNNTPYRSLGFFGIIKYVWDQKYIIDLNGRRDGSTKFGPSNRFGNFGSAAVAWIFSEEPWMKNHMPFISFGKLRGSAGVIGGDAIADYAYLSTYTAGTATYAGKPGLTPNSLSNPNLEWEKNRDLEVGMELGFLNNRIYAEANYYRNKVSNQLVSQPLSTVTGYGSYTLNSDAIIRNSGWEMVLNTTNIVTKNFNWKTKFNISVPGSKLLKVPTQANQNSNYILGKPVTGLLLYKYNGVNPETGYYSFTNKKGVTDDYTGGLKQEDKTEFVDLAPKFYGGFENSFGYKQWSLDVTFTFTNRVGKNMLGQLAIPFGFFGLNGTTLWLDRWQKPGDKTDVPRVTSQITGIFRQLLFQESTGAYSNAAYARLQNVNISYHFKNEALKKMRLKGLSVYLRGQNLLTISRFGGLDPENMNANVIPPLRVFTAGINLTL